MGRTIASTCVFKVCSFQSCLPQNNNVESQNLRRLQTETATANYFYFHLELNAASIRYAEVELWRRKRQ